MGDPSALYNQADRNAAMASVAQTIGSLDTTKCAAAVGTFNTADAENWTPDLARRQLEVRTWVSSMPAAFTGRATHIARNMPIGGDGTGTPGIYSQSAWS